MATLTKSVRPQSGYNYYTYTCVVTENSTNVANNTSNITITFYIRGPWSPSYEQWTTYCGIIVDGSTKKTGSNRSTVSTSNVEMLSWTGDISHNSDGSKSIEVSVYLYNGSASYLPSQSTESSPYYMGSVALTTIPRASSVSCSTANIGSNATITINRASSSFTHTLTYAFGSLSGTIATKTSSTNISWTIPTTFYGQIPNSKSGTGTITCDTYNGSTLIGSKSTSFTATVSESASKPTLSPTVSDSNTTTTALTGNSSKFIKYYSNASVATGAKARNSATLKSQKITCGAKSLTSASGTINAVESGSFTFSATDSRGYTTTQTVNKTLIEYIKLTCSLNAGAPTTAGVATLKISGNYWDGTFGKLANTLTVQYRYKAQGGSYGSWTTVSATKSNNTYNATATISGLNYQTTYVFQARAVDKLATISTDEQARRTTPIFDWSKNDFNVNGTLKINNTNIFDLIYPVGSIYISVNSTSPKVLFGGTWERIMERFLFGCGDERYPAGHTGGEEQHVLTVQEMPSHKGHLSAGISGGVPMGKGNYEGYLNKSVMNDYPGGNYRGWNVYAGNEMHPASEAVGESWAHNNMPPYLCVYIWKRTA